MKKPAKKLSIKQHLQAIWGVAALTFKAAPGTVLFKLVGILVTAGLPIAITYFAAATTTELAAAFSGNQGAGQLALIYIAITAVLGLFTTIWSSIEQYLQAVLRYRVEAKVSDIMYERFLSLEFWRYDDKDTVDLYERAQRFTQFFAYVFDRIADILTTLITLIFAIMALAFVLPAVAAVVLVAVIPGIFLQLKLSRAQMTHWNNNVDTRRARYYIEGNLFQPSSIIELRLNGLVRHLLEYRNKLREQDEKTQLTFERQYIGKRLMADVLEAVVELGSLIWVALQIIGQLMPLGNFVYVQQLVSRAFGSANRFVSQLATIDEDLANLFDYRQFMMLSLPPTKGRPLQAPPNVISFKDVSFAYPNAKKPVLKHVSLTILRGQHIAIVGENGAGKSTFLKLLLGLYVPSRGSVELDGVPVENIVLQSWHDNVAMLQQEFEKYHFTNIKNNVYFGDVSQPVDDARLQDAIAKAEASEFIEKLPQKLATYPNTWLDDEEGNKGVQLSGGQWQRLAIARSFYRDANVLILDEPTSAIDALAEARIFKRLFSKQNQKTVITVSHRLSTVEKADTIIVLEDGKIVEQGTHAELVAKKGAYVRLFESQLSNK